MTPVDYGNALYYPHIFPSSRRWLRTAALYHDHIGRIVPQNFFSTRSTRGREGPLLDDFDALQDCGFIQDEHPELVVDDVAESFIDFLSVFLREEKDRLGRTPELSAGGDAYNMYRPKMSPVLTELLIGQRLARFVGNDEIEIEPTVGGIYMLFLAQQMAQARPIVTDNPAFEALMFRPQTHQDIESIPSDPGFLLATAVFNTMVPVDIESVPLGDLIKFRTDHTDDRMAFYDEIAKLTSDLRNVTHEKELSDAIEHRSAAIRKKITELKNKLRLLKVTVGTGIFTVSIPGYITSAAFGLALTNPLVLSTVAGMVVTGVLAKSHFEKQAIKAAQGTYYVHSLQQNLAPNAYADEIIQLHLGGRALAAEPTFRQRVGRKFRRIFRRG